MYSIPRGYRCYMLQNIQERFGMNEPIIIEGDAFK